jgi:uncharacterized membrane protein YphA (DoxX/SURF4 family)
MRALYVLGRLIFGGYFVYNGVNHFMNREMMSQYAAAKGVPSAHTAVPATGTMLLAGGLSIMAGLKPRQGLATLVAFLLPVTLQMHQFWTVDDPQQRMNEMVNFSKNIALIGAALMLLQLDHPWPASIDSAMTEEEMFVHLGGRDLRALPA